MKSIWVVWTKGRGFTEHIGAFETREEAMRVISELQRIQWEGICQSEFPQNLIGWQDTFYFDEVCLFEERDANWLLDRQRIKWNIREDICKAKT